MIIKLLLIVPYAIFKKLIEPYLVEFYDVYLHPFYERHIEGVPGLDIVVRFGAKQVSRVIQWMTHTLDFMSGKMA
jgi:hypothetical protein